jgi:uncharacterized OB-fold protein
MAERAKPKPNDVSQAFWDGTGRGELMLQHDPASGRGQFYPRPVNLFSESAPQWKPASGLGTLVAVSTVRTPVPGFEPPFMVCLVKLDEGPRVFARLLNAAPSAAPGGRVRLVWETDGEPPRLYAFEPA